LLGKLEKRMLIGVWVLFIAVVFVMVLMAINETNPTENMAFEDEERIEDGSPHGDWDLLLTGTRANATTDPCIDCHNTAGILEEITLDWQKSKHAQNNVSCIDCHEADPGDPDAMSHAGGTYLITHVVSPKDCSAPTCHPNEAAEFEQSLHSFGGVYYEYLFDREKLPFLESQIEGAYLVRDGDEIEHAATLRGCQACHGTNMTGKNIDDWTVWPNNGIGRINPDGSRGSCSACHTRHSFSIAEARHPETCGQCHMGPDHPQIEIYMESKHGNIYSSEGDTWNWSKNDWVAGVDYRAPTCAGCHMSGIPDNDDVNTTHDVSSRLSWELEPAVSRRTDNIANSLGVPFSDGSTWQEKQGRMKDVCKQCHSKIWVDNYYEQSDLAIELYNEQYNSTLEIVKELYDEGLLTSEAFDEPIEFKIYEMWHHEGRRARMGAVMQAPDYVQWHGFYDLLQDRVEIEHMAHDIREAAMEPEEEEEPIIVFLARDGPGTTIILKWEITHPTSADHYDLYWGTDLITDYESLTPNANTTQDSISVPDLIANTTYYFTIVAVDSDGNETAIAFSSAMPPKAEVTPPDDDDDDDEDGDGLDPMLPLIVAIIAILLALIGMMMAARKGGSSSPSAPKEPIEKEEPKEEPEESPED
jgi:hypothetical protein